MYVFMCECVCVYVCVYVCLYVCMYVWEISQEIKWTGFLTTKNQFFVTMYLIRHISLLILYLLMLSITQAIYTMPDDVIISACEFEVWKEPVLG